MAFQYDAFGNLTRTTDPENNQILIGYDILGRKTQMDDPDKGALSYSYYANGQLKSQTDANGHITNMTYDVLGRMASRTITGEGAGTSTWSYDACTNGVGQLCSKTGNGLTESYVYTDQGLLAQSTTTIDSLDYTHTYTYDSYGRNVSTQYPTGYTTTATYHNELGFAHQLKNNNKVIWEATSFTARGNIENLALNNGTIHSSKYFEDQDSLVRSINVYHNDTAVALLNYDWSKTGNLKRTEDYVSMVTYGYTYDDLSRLESYTTSIAGNHHSSVTMAYDALGNITSKSDVGTYSYNQQHAQCSAAGTTNSAQAGPHAVSYVTGKGAYCYDHNGNMLSGDGRTLQYTSFDKPYHITQNGETSTFSYGPDFQRYKQVTTANLTSGSVDKTTYYIGSYEKEIRDNEIFHRIQIGDVAIVEKAESLGTETLHYTVRDQLGSLIATINESTGDVTRLFYDPWGKREELPVVEIQDQIQSLQLIKLQTFVTPRGYTGHEHLDNVGLIHMNGRVYDAELARFVSADPVITDPTYLQSYNRYSYVWNRPLNHTDPSGYDVLSDEERASGYDQNDPEQNGEAKAQRERDKNERDRTSRSQEEAAAFQAEAQARHETAAQYKTNSAIQAQRFTSGPGKWVTTDVNKQGIRNFFQMILKRIETLGDKGRLWGSDGKDFEGTVQNVTQEWEALSTSDVKSLSDNGYTSVDRIYGETRVVRQTFLKGPDPWKQGGKSWYWQPSLRNEEFELQKTEAIGD